MKTEIIHRIEELESEIEIALGETNFVKLSELSTNIGNAIKELTDNFLSKSPITDEDVKVFERLRSRIEFFEKETGKRFGDFAGKTSIKKKMHDAYKKYGV